MSDEEIRLVICYLTRKHDTAKCAGCGICDEVQALGKRLIKEHKPYVLRKYRFVKHFKNKTDARKYLVCGAKKVNEMIETGCEYKGYTLVKEWD